ncbi:hypothetical protein DFO61_0461 [Ectopseudomonas oleovorans]|uniref:Uncharacterized protein n=2 Tax=Pseudomonadaceae TaxID=135621 RepID=A0A397NMQ4_ECTOL|nr:MULTISPECIES: hypothetical protein [Pseudomonas]QMV61042.1 hypothetical protein HS968_13370 [Pseudomonas berkeleyensis]RIA36005.1 hypothetical protein DFO61_0461 [Pseudomonas oleovorans]WSO36467.1 hypothetical protein VUJ49_13425 [Pseudomonas berkeleyensis]
MHLPEQNSRSEPIRENMPLQIRGWQIERLGWYGLLLLVGLALGGLFSKGPLSDAQVVSEQGDLLLDYQRFARNGAQSQLIVTLEERSRLSIAGELLDGFSIDSIQPAPMSSASDGNGGLVLDFRVGAERTVVSIRLTANGVGSYRSTLHAADQQVELNQFIYP